ncbi:MAG: anaerobic ribonucleoside-triphosphate reductase activating protein [Actinomycetota bacterium]
MACFENMRGLLPSSMLDWPGKICAVLFLGGCNFCCPYCHNPELLAEGGPAETIAWDDLAFFLRERSGWLDGVSITGGEPTIHDDLPLLCGRLKAMGMAVKIDSNGSRPRLLAEMLSDGLVDFVAMDLKASLARYPQVVRRPVDPGRIGESIRAIIASGVEHEFRCTVVPGLVGLEDLESLARRLEGAASLVLQQFRSERTLEPGYAGRKGYADEVLLDWSEKLSRTVPTRVRGLVGAAR